MSSSAETAARIEAAASRNTVIRVRSASGNYLAALFVASFLSALLLQLERPWGGLLVFGAAWILIPLAALTDRLTFDGIALRRRGMVAFVSKLLTRRDMRIRVDEVESVVTIAIRTLRSAGRIYYRYRSEITGEGHRLTLVSGGVQYRQMVRRLYPLIADPKMDVRSCELRDYLVEPQGIESSLRLLNLASSSVLANAVDLPRRLQRAAGRAKEQAEKLRHAPDTARGILLQRVANELRLGGRWRQAAEAFRRALLLLPGDARLLLEFGRFARSQGNALRNPRFHRRARAALRLSAWIARRDPALLARLGETNFEFGETETAGKLFRSALAGESRLFRAELGLAELALRDGKLAHVIHHFSASAAIAPDAALKKFAKREIEYYSELNQNDDYLTKELRRVSWLQNILNARRLTTRLTAVGLSLVIFGSLLNETITVIGWAVATTALATWCALMLAGRLLSNRREITAE